jgi:Holliday junction resolvase RusA-like endonuclease
VANEFSEEWLKTYQKDKYKPPPLVSPMERAIEAVDPGDIAEKASLTKQRTARKKAARTTAATENYIKDGRVYKFTMDYPALLNSLYRIGKNGMYLTKEGHKYKEETAPLQILAGFRRKPFAGSVAVNLHIYRPYKRGDIDGVNKLILDSMEKIVYANDESVREQHSYKREDKLNPRVDVEVWEL